MTEDMKWMLRTFHEAFKPKKNESIDEWVDAGNLSLALNTPEPGLYSLERTPYQRDILRRMSPQDPTQEVYLCFGSQTGKTTMEGAIMSYYIKERPAPMGFAFSDEGNLKTYVSKKFDPLMAANPAVSQCFRSDGSAKADTQSGKQYPGGYLKFFSGKSESSMRGDSFKIAIADEIDAAGQTKGGDIKSMLQARVTVYGETSKLCLSSTPLNHSHMIWDYLNASTFNKYFVKCPHCGKEMTFELEYLKYTVNRTSVTAAWMECPHCGGKIYNEDKLSMLKTGEWKPTISDANPLCQGYYLPSFYAPVGWVSWLTLAQQYYNAGFLSGTVDHEKMTTFFNTRLAMPYVLGAVTSEAKNMYERNQDSPYRRGDIPSWVHFITTGADVQKNRIEVKIMGWGKRNRNITIDCLILYVPNDEEITTPDGDIWNQYTEEVLNASFTREDGLILHPVAHAIDSSYESETLYAYYLKRTPEQKRVFHLVKGSDRATGKMSTLKRVKKELYTGTEWLEVPASSLKHYIFGYLCQEDDVTHTKADINLFPRDFDLEFYEQIYSEQYVKEGKSRYLWKKTRDRNEGLDTLVYNYAMYYYCGYDNLTDEDWDMIAETERKYLEELGKPIINLPPRRRRKISGGISI